MSSFHFNIHSFNHHSSVAPVQHSFTVLLYMSDWYIKTDFDRFFSLNPAHRWTSQRTRCVSSPLSQKVINLSLNLNINVLFYILHIQIFILICTWYIVIHRFFISLKSLREQTGSRRWDSDLFLTPVFFNQSFHICSTNPFDRFRLCLRLPIGPEIKKNTYLFDWKNERLLISMTKRWTFCDWLIVVGTLGQ